MALPRSSTGTLAMLAVLAGGCGILDFAGDARLCNGSPAAKGLVSERVVLRGMMQYTTDERRLYLDRVRYLDSNDVLSPDRVVVAYPETPVLLSQVEAVGAVPGDTLRVDTRFVNVVRLTVNESTIPRFAGNEGKCMDGAHVGRHALVRLTR